MIKGSLAIKIGSEEFVLEPEDAIYFDSAVLHSYRRRGPEAVYGSDRHGAVRIPPGTRLA